MIRPFALAALVLLAACAESGAAPASAPVLELEEAYAYVLPDSLRLNGLTARDSANVLAWSADRLLLVNPMQTAGSPVVRHLRAAPIAAAVTGESTFEVVDAAGEWRGDLHPSQSPASTGRWTVVTQPLNAARTPKGWVGGGRDEHGRYRLVSLLSSGAPRVLWTVSPDTLRGGRLPAYLLSPSAAGVLMSEAESPFRTWRVDWDGTVHVPFAPRRAALPPRRPGQDARWVALPVVDLGSGYLQTLADLGSDRRVLVTFDQTGRQVRASVLRVPVGIAGKSEDGRFLVGARDVGQPELVLYRWRWKSANPLQGETP